MEEAGGPHAAADASGSGGFGHAYDRAEVPRILDSEDEDDGARPLQDLRRRDIASPRDRDQVLRSPGLREALDHGARDQPRTRRGQEREASRTHAVVVQDVIE